MKCANVQAVFPPEVTWEADIGPFAPEKAERVLAFHRSFPEYAPTPLYALNALAAQLGLGGLWVKDESCRFGLNAFKVLGGSYSMGRCLAARLGLDVSDISCRGLQQALKERGGEALTFITATDGNHGRGVAWTAARLGLRSVVLMPRGSAAERLENIRALGAHAWITELNYDDTVRLAARMAEEKGWVLLQDTSWPGYEELPGYIMQGYGTMALEALREMEAAPTHVFLQAGVGAMAGAVTGFLAAYYPEERRPKIVIVEPEAADCLFRSARADDGTLHTVGGDLSTMMAGLACGEPCTIAWPLLRRYASCFVSMTDELAALGMRTLARPLGEDAPIVSGESGAATVGFLTALMTREELVPLRRELGLDEKSRVLCFSTEGDTDRENYRRIMERA